MVRLKGEGSYNDGTSITKFQFQYGAIKGNRFVAVQLLHMCFNYSMVRLKATTLLIRMVLKKFQFQYGAIKGESY